MAYPKVLKWLGFVVLVGVLVSFAGCGGSSKSSSSSSKSNSRSGGLPNSVIVEVMNQLDCSFDQIKNISGHKISTDASGKEIWQGRITYAPTKLRPEYVVTTTWGPVVVEGSGAP